MTAIRTEAPWQEMLTEQQRKVFNAACGDLAQQVKWYGNRLSKDDWRHFISGTVLGWRMLPGINHGEGAPGFVILGGSSLDLSKPQYSEALDCGTRERIRTAGTGTHARMLPLAGQPVRPGFQSWR